MAFGMEVKRFPKEDTERIWQTEKKTVVLVTNNIDEAVYLGDRIVVLEGKLPGRLGSVHRVPLPRPREHTDLEFVELRERIQETSELVL